MFAEDAHVHPTFNKLIEHFRLEQKNTDVIVSQIQSGKIFIYNVQNQLINFSFKGDSFNLRKKQLIKEEKLKDLVENYNFANLFDFFNSLILLMDAPAKKYNLFLFPSKNSKLYFLKYIF